MNNKNRFSAFIIGLFVFVFATSCAATSHNDGQDYYDPEHRPFGRYDEPVVINGVMEFLSHNDSRVPSSITPETNVFIKKLKEEMNIEWRYMWKVPSSQYENKLTATILSKNYPDILRLNASQYNNFLKQGLLKDLTETYKYASPKVQEYLNRDPEVIERLKQDDGKIYTIPQYDDIKREVPVMYFRKDWLEKEKLSIPKTPAELKNVLQVFKDKYNATAGLAMSKSISGSHFSINRYLQMFGSNPFSFVKNGNDELIASEVTNESKNALTYLADLFKSGLLDPNFGSNDATMVESNVKQQKTGVIFGPWWQYEFPLADLLPSQDWGAAEIPLEEGAKLVLPKQQITYYYVVLKKCKNPETLMKMINAYIEWDGAEGCKAEDGYVWSWCPTQFYDPYDINMQYVEMNKKLETDPTASGEPDPNWPNHLKKLWEVYPDYLSWKEDHGSVKFQANYFSNIIGRINKDGAWAAINKTYEKNNYVFNEYYSTPTNAQYDFGSQIATHTEVYFAKAIMGEKNTTSDWDAYVKEWYNLGGTEVMESINEWYRSHKG